MPATILDGNRYLEMEDALFSMYNAISSLRRLVILCEREGEIAYTDEGRGLYSNLNDLQRAYRHFEEGGIRHIFSEAEITATPRGENPMLDQLIDEYYERHGRRVSCGEAEGVYEGIGEDYMDFYRILRTDTGDEVWCRLCEEMKVIGNENDKGDGNKKEQRDADTE